MHSVLFGGVPVVDGGWQAQIRFDEHATDCWDDTDIVIWQGVEVHKSDPAYEEGNGGVSAATKAYKEARDHYVEVLAEGLGA